jgi:hypothetical protein
MCLTNISDRLANRVPVRESLGGDDSDGERSRLGSGGGRVGGVVGSRFPVGESLRRDDGGREARLGGRVSHSLAHWIPVGKGLGCDDGRREGLGRIAGACQGRLKANTGLDDAGVGGSLANGVPVTECLGSDAGRGEA